MKRTTSVGKDTRLPDYRVRISTRARHLQLKVTATGHVEVVVPRGSDPRAVPLFVAQHRVWLDRTLARVRAERAHPELGAGVPSVVDLAAIGERWRIETAASLGSRTRVAVHEAGGGVLKVGGDQEDATRQLLQRWLTRRARQRLVPWLGQVSEECGLAFARASVRAQRTRWGSCSSRDTISINRSLLFLPPHLVRYLFIHELCHTVHRNHSRRYWALVARFEPDCRRLDAELHEAGRLVPLWAYPDPG